MTALEPPDSEFAAPFWDATRAEQLLLAWCSACAKAMWYPREVCPSCLGTAIEWRPAAGTGVVYAFSVHHLAGPGRDTSELPYTVAIIELPEGVRMMSNVVDCEPDAVSVGMAVRVAWKPLSDGRNLPQFAPA